MESNKSYSTNTPTEHLIGTLAVALVGYLMIGYLYETFWKHFTLKQKRFFVKFIVIYSWVFVLAIGYVGSETPKKRMVRYDFGGKIYYVPREEKLHLYPDTYSDTGEKFGE